MKNTPIYLIILLALISIIQIMTNGLAIYKNVFRHKNLDGVRLFEWVNFSIGFGTLIFLLFIFINKDFLSNDFTKSFVIGLILLNILTMLFHYFSFFK